MEKTKQTYVFKGKEVFLTGRKAKKESRRGRVKELFEVKPTRFPETDEGEWVEMRELFEIVEDEKNE
jgi:hypothetical protein